MLIPNEVDLKERNMARDKKKHLTVWINLKQRNEILNSYILNNIALKHIKKNT